MAGPFERAYTRRHREGRAAAEPAASAAAGAVRPARRGHHAGGRGRAGTSPWRPGLIAAVSKRKPTDVPVVETDGVILPGLIDLHGHPDFNVFAAWEPPKLYANRYRWRASAPYKALVRDPQNTHPQHPAAADAEPVCGGAGARGRYDGDPGFERGEHEQERGTVGAQRGSLDLRRPQGAAMIDLPSASSRDMPRLEKIVADIGTGDVNAFYLHLCEGVRGDERSAKEFQAFLDSGAATPATNVIHGSALSEGDLHTLADAGCRLVWSPQSNLRLYGSTTLAGAAMAAGMPVALGADWLPSGSTSLLGR